MTQNRRIMKEKLNLFILSKASNWNFPQGYGRKTEWRPILSQRNKRNRQGAIFKKGWVSAAVLLNFLINSTLNVA